MTKSFADVINGIRTAIYGREVREDIAQMGEYVEQFAETTIQKATESKNSATAAKESENASKQTLDEVKTAAENASNSAIAAARSEQGAGGNAEAAAASASAAEQSEKKAEEHANKAIAAVNTDKTLTVSGAPADAKTVGDELSNRYTKLEVDNKISGSSITTDKTLSISGAAADAKVVGDKLNERYTKSEVDQKIEDVHIETDATLTVSGAAADAKATGDALAKKLPTDSSSYIRRISISGNTITIIRGDGTGYQSPLAESYTLPAATYSTLGGVIVGTNLSITSSGVLSAIDGASIVAKSIGTDNSYIRLSNGIQICWGFASYRYVTFLAPFVNDSSVGFASHTDYAGSTTLVNATKTILSANFSNWIAIGLWK